MDQNLMKALAQIMEEHKLTLLELEEEGTKIKLERAAAVAPAAVTQAAPVMAPAAATTPDVIDFNQFKEVKSPMVGVFYAAPSPDAEPFVKVGDRVKKGDIICIIEAMKLMNEITAEEDGEVVDICVQNGEVVEYGQTLVKLS
jgi:acetyl-CoA carboxylase biotin carboxyl carrier protein